MTAAKQRILNGENGITTLMPQRLTISAGFYSDKGRKAINQDCHGLRVPDGSALRAKGVAIAIADGVSSSTVGHVASQAAVAGFLEDYYCTPETWSVKRSAQRVLNALNAWLHSQTRRSHYRFERDKGYLCTFSALIIKGATAHLFHVGDARIYRFRNYTSEQLTNDHRLWVADDISYLSRALGFETQLEIDYQPLPVETGDLFALMTDGVYEYIDCRNIAYIAELHRDDLDSAAKILAERAYEQGSPDNLTIQLIRIDGLPERDADEQSQQWMELPTPPMLQAGMRFDGYTIARELHVSSRSHVYLAVDDDSQHPVVIKTPSIDRSDDAAYLERFLIEDWIARRIDNPHVLKAHETTRQRRFLYSAFEHIDGCTLTQWMRDHPQVNLETVRGIVEQIVKGLRAFHRLEMLHRDLRPDNILVDRNGVAKIIDFGSTRVAGLTETGNGETYTETLGAVAYLAPEYLLGEEGTPQSDQFSLGVIAYQMLTGRLPYGADVAKHRTRTGQNRLTYRPAAHGDRSIPAWVDAALKKAVHPNPLRRYESLSEFAHDLRYPNAEFLSKTRPPLLERDPVVFWKGVALILSLIIIALLTHSTNRGI